MAAEKTYKIGHERAKQLLQLAHLVQAQEGDWRDALDDLVETFEHIVDTTSQPERVIFRRFPHDGKVIALFPDQLNERTGNIGSYMRDGQHAETYPDFGDTKPCESWTEFGDLYRELQDVAGYTNLKIVKRFGKLGRK